MSGLTNYPAGGDPPVEEACFLASDAVEATNVNPKATADAISSSIADPNSVEATTAEPTSAVDITANRDSWRDELTARLERYRTRRKPRTPRYPSLLLPFDAPENWSRPAPSGGSTALGTARAEPDFALDGNQQPASVRTPGIAKHHLEFGQAAQSP